MLQLCRSARVSALPSLGPVQAGNPHEDPGEATMTRRTNGLGPLLRAALWLVLAVALSPSALAKLNVVATTPDLGALARSVGGDAVEVTVMALPTQDPHFVDPKPSLALRLARADALLLVGLDLESGWLPTLLTASRNARIQPGAPGYIDCSSFVTVLGVPTGKVDRSQGDVHPLGNPHYLRDPRAGLAVGEGLTRRFAELSPADAPALRATGAAWAAQLRLDIAAWKKELAGYQGAPVVTFHASMPYLLAWLGAREVATIEPRPGIPPTPAHVVHVIQRAKQEGARVVLQESYYPDRTGKLIAEKLGGTLVELPGGPDFQAGESYTAFMKVLVERLARGLRATASAQ